MSGVGVDLWSSERDRAESFLLLLIEDGADPQEIEPLIQEVVRKVDSFPFVVSVVYRCGARGTGSSFRIYEKVNIVALRKLASDRLSKHFIEGNRNIFEELSERDWGIVLYAWGTNWETDSKDNQLV